MRSYMIEEIDQKDMEKIVQGIRQMALKSPVDDLFWIELPDELFSDVQKEHSESCGPHYMAVETGKDWVKLELLVRCERKIRCDCISLADSRQREFMIEYLDQLIKEFS